MEAENAAELAACMEDAVEAAEEAPATNGDGGFGAFDDGAADGAAAVEAAAEEPPAADGFDFDDAGAEEEAELERQLQKAREAREQYLEKRRKKKEEAKLATKK